MDALQKKVEDYENRMREYETKRVAYERKITRLQGDLFEKEQEIRRAKYSLVRVFPELEGDAVGDLRSVSGLLDEDLFKKACLEACRKEQKPSDSVDDARKRESTAEAKAEVLHQEWQDKVRDDRWGLYARGEGEGQGEVIQIESEDLLRIKEKYGDELYHHIKNAWLDWQESRRTLVVNKPWDSQAGREKTLSELTDTILAASNRNPNH